MKKRLYRAAGFILAFVMILTTVVPALANESGATKGKVRRETLELEHGTMYFEETSDYAIAFTVYDNGRITYAIRYEGNPDLIYSGAVSAEQNKEAERQEVFSLSADRFALVDELLEMETTDVTDLKEREVEEEPQRDSPSVTSVEAAKERMRGEPGFVVPYSNALIGTYYGTKTVQIYQTVGLYAYELSVVRYYLGDFMETLFLGVITNGLGWDDLLSVVTWGPNFAGDLIAQSNGSLYLFKVENPRTRRACIDGTVYYWAGWDKDYLVYSGDKGTNVNITRDFKAADYNYGLDYWGEKAIASYENYSGG